MGCQPNPRQTHAFGHGAEAALHRPNTALSMLRQLNHLTELPLVGATDDGTEIAANLATGQSSARRPQVEVHESAERVELRALGTEAVLRKILKDWRKRYGDVVPAFDDLPDRARRTLAFDPVEIKVSIAHDLDAGTTFAVKVAVEAGVLAFGPEFASGDVAEALRAFRDRPSAEQDAAQAMDVAALDALDQTFAQQADGMEGSGLGRPDLPRLGLPGAVNDVTFVPVGVRTAVFVRILGMPVAGSGIVVDAELPAGGGLGRPAAPILVRESAEGLEIVHFTERLLAPVLARTQADDARTVHDT